MARARGVDCIFCESDPCTCNLKAKRTPRAAAPKSPKLPTVRRVVETQLPEPASNPLAGRIQQATDNDSIMLDALKNLASAFPGMVLVSGDESLGPTSREFIKLLSWKERIRRGREKL